MSKNSNPAFRAKCPSCGFEETGERYEDVTFVVSKHQEHTGHEMDWEHTDFDRAVSKDEVYKLTCAECDDYWRFNSLFELEQFRAEHEMYTNHDVSNEPAVETVDAVSVTNLTHSLDNLETVLSMLDRGNSTGVPKSVIFELFENENTDSIKERLEEFKRTGKVYEPKKGYVRYVQ